MSVCWVGRLAKGKESGGWKGGDHEVTQTANAHRVGQQINEKNIFSIGSIFSTVTLQLFEYGYDLNVTGFSFL